MSEWQIDSNTGRRFRRVGESSIEWEPDYIFSGGTKLKIKEPEKSSVRLCPFEETAYNRHECRRDACAWWLDGCVIVTGSKVGKLGASCPLSRNGRQCVRECMMHESDGYCAVTRRL